MGVWSRYEDIDVERQRYRRCGPPVVIYDHGPQLSSAPSRAEMRLHQREHEEWLRASGGKPYRIALSSVDAFEWCRRDRRFSFSATEREPVQVQSKTTTTTPQFVYIAGCGGQAALPCGHLSDLMNPGVTLVAFSVDFWEILSRDQRYQIIKTP
jgi:hypothetical protein